MALVTAFEYAGRFPPGTRTLLDGRDITAICQESDAEQGWARVYVFDDAGHHRLNWVTREAQTEVEFGRVEYVAPAATKP